MVSSIARRAFAVGAGNRDHRARDGKVQAFVDDADSIQTEGDGLGMQRFEIREPGAKRRE
jgi:hypothetical protein